MTRDVDTGAGHVQLAEETLRQVITNLPLAELSIGAILYEIGRSTVFITGIVGGQCGDVTSCVGSGPSTEHAVTLVRTGIGDAIEVGLELLVVVNILTGNTLPEHVEVKVFITQVDIQTPREVGHRTEDPSLVLLVDDTVTIKVTLFKTTYTGILLTAGQNLFAVLEQAINHITYD